MKKIIPLLLALLLLCACAEAPQPGETPEQTPEPEERNETAAPEQTPEPETAPGTALPEEDDEMKKGTVTLDGVDSYLRLTLPEGWDWTEGEAFEDRSSLILTPRTNDGFHVDLVWWAYFGMCGTGVEFSEYPLPDGRTATLAVDRSGDQVWWTLILPDSPDQFTIQFGAPQSVIDAHRGEIDQILESLHFGELSHIPPQPTTPLVDK